MKLKHPTCKHCGAANKTVRTFFCKRNLLNQYLKTNYCKKCAGLLYPKPLELDAGIPSESVSP